MARRQQCSIRTCCSTSIAGGGGVNNYQLRTGISLADSVCVTDNDIGDEGSQALFGGFKNNTVFTTLSLSSTIPKRTSSDFTWIALRLLVRVTKGEETSFDGVV